MTIFVALAVAGAPAALSCQQTTTARSVLRRDLEAEARRLEQLFERGDLRAVARTYADDAQLIPPSGQRPKTGRAEIDRFWADVDDPRSWTLETLDWGGTADEAWHLVLSTMVSGRDKPRAHVVRCLFIWRRQPDGTRRIHLDIWTAAVKGHPERA